MVLVVADAQIEAAVAKFIEEEIAYERVPASVAPEEPLLDGLVDSTDLLRLVLFVEERYGIRVENEDLVPENFETVRQLAAFVEKKLV